MYYAFCVCLQLNMNTVLHSSRMSLHSRVCMCACTCVVATMRHFNHMVAHGEATLSDVVDGLAARIDSGTIATAARALHAAHTRWRYVLMSRVIFTAKQLMLLHDVIRESAYCAARRDFMCCL